MALPFTSKNIIQALKNLGDEKNKMTRQAILNAGLKEMLKWFTFAAQTIIENKIKLPKQTQKYMNKHKDEVQKLANPAISEEEKRRIILKPGGGGFLGGVIIRNLLRWDGQKTIRIFDKKVKKRKSPKMKKSPKKSRKRKVDERFITMRRKSKTPSPIHSTPLSSRHSTPNHLSSSNISLISGFRTPSISPLSFSQLKSPYHVPSITPPSSTHISPDRTIPITSPEVRKRLQQMNITTPEKNIFQSIHKHVKRNPDGTVHHVEPFSPLHTPAKKAVRKMYKNHGDEVRKVLTSFFGRNVTKRKKSRKHKKNKKRK